MFQNLLILELFVLYVYNNIIVYEKEEKFKYFLKHFKPFGYLAASLKC